MAQAAVYACFKALKGAASQAGPLPEGPDAAGVVQVWPSREPPRMLTPGLVEAWEELDRRLSQSDQGDLINRIIFAHRCLEGQLTAGKYPVKELQADWRRVLNTRDAKLRALHGHAAAAAQRLPWLGLVFIAASLINAELAERWQVAVIFAAGTGMGMKDTYDLLIRLTQLSASAIFARISRMGRAFGPEEGAEA